VQVLYFPLDKYSSLSSFALFLSLQEELLKESESMVPDSTRRFEAAHEELSALLVRLYLWRLQRPQRPLLLQANAEDLKETEEYISAKNVIETVQL